MLDQLANGILLGALLATSSVGLSLILSVTHTINVAHGDLLTLGAMMAVFFSTAYAIPVWIALLLAIAIGLSFGGLIDFGLLSPLRRRGVGVVAMLVVTIGLSFVLRYGILAIGGPRPKALPLPSARVSQYFGMGFTPMALVSILISIVVLVSVGIFLMKTSLGTAMRAVASNRTLASASGIHIERVMRLTWIIAGGLTAVGGVMLALTQLVFWNVGFQLLLLMFAAVIVGGVGSPFGTMVGGFLIGIVSQMSVALPYVRDHADLKIVVAMAVMFIVLIVRPNGILGRGARLS